VAVFVANLCQHHKPRRPLDQGGNEAVARASSQVTLPVPRYGPVICLCRSVTDRDCVVKPAQTNALQDGVARPTNGPRCAQMRQKLLSKYATCLDEQAPVDRLVRDPFIVLIGMFAHQPTCDLLWRPVAGQLG
jgi:hypothetical protein